MCGIVGAIAERNVTNILIAGLKRLEYRGYDSAGLALNSNGAILRLRREGKVQGLEDAAHADAVSGQVGIAHTRWATHGKPLERNAHPHMSGDDIALVHNGIIENFQELKAELQADGYEFSSDTDTEVIVHLIHRALRGGNDMAGALRAAVERLHGAYALAVMALAEPDHLLVVRSGSPLVIGLGIGENFIASDLLALLPVTTRFIFLEEGDVAAVSRESVSITDHSGKPVERAVHEFDGNHEDAEKGEYRHYMLKEIFEQPVAVQKTLEGRIGNEAELLASFGSNARELLSQVAHVQIVACGTSSHAGMVARYWMEAIAGVACQVEVASEFRYRKHVVPANTLLLTISQSGETADTLAALRASHQENYLARFAVCNVDSSSLVRESELSLLTRAAVGAGDSASKRSPH